MNRINDLFEFFIQCLSAPEIVYKTKRYVPEILSILSDDEIETFNKLYSKVDYESDKYNPIPYNMSRMRNFAKRLENKYCDG